MPPRKRTHADASSSNDSADEVTHTLVATHIQLSTECTNLTAMWRSGQLCDVKIAVDSGKHFAAHKIVLAAGSDFFKALFTSGMKDSDNSTVTVSEISSDVMSAILTFLYEKRVSVTPSTLAAIMRAASQLEIASLLALSSSFLAETLSVETCIATWDVALAMARPELAFLLVACESMAEAKFEQLSSRTEFASLSAAQITPLLKSDETSATEEIVFKALTSWLSARQPPLPQASALELLSLIRYPLMKPEIIHSEVEPFLSSYGPDGHALVFEAYRYQSLSTLPTSERPQSARTRPRFPSIPYGVQLSFPSEFLHSWTCQFELPYSDETTRAKLEAVPAHATHIFVGARSPDGKIVLGACGERDKVLQRTRGYGTHENNGVYWYNTTEAESEDAVIGERGASAFGFSPTSRVRLCGADTIEEDGKFRLSWHLELEETGGYRAGETCPEEDEDGWSKLVYWK